MCTPDVRCRGAKYLQHTRQSEFVRSSFDSLVRPCCHFAAQQPHPLMFSFRCRLEWLHDIAAHPREHEGPYKRRSDPVRPLQSNRYGERVAHALALGNEFVHESRVVTSLEL